MLWFVLAAFYLGFIFCLGSWGDGFSRRAKKLSAHPLVYAFALAIYCTAWTYYGAVGEAARNGWDYFPIFLGPILVYLFAYKVIIKLIHVSKKHHITTIADLISARYGKRHTIALMVTLIVMLAAIPYIALQLQAIGSAFSLVSGTSNSSLLILAATVFIGAFCVYFGTRRTDVTEYRHGLMLSIAFESLLKFIALGAVAVFALFAVDLDFTVMRQGFFSASSIQASITSGVFWLQTVIAAAAVLCLPRQFHVAIIDNLNIKHVRTARWVFPGYLLLMALLIPVIASVGASLFAGQSVSPDTYVTLIAALSDSLLLQAMVFLGGLSASIAMLVVATLTLSTMVSNDVILPKLLNADERQAFHKPHTDFILWLRRAVIVVILCLSYSCHVSLSGELPLSSMGLLAFSLLIHLFPAIFAGLYWQKAHANGVIAGFVAGLSCWGILLIAPLLSGKTDLVFANEMISISAAFSLFVNGVFFVVFSSLATPNLLDKMQATSFVTNAEFDGTLTLANKNITNQDLLTVLTTFLGNKRTHDLLHDYKQRLQEPFLLSDHPDQPFIIFCERALGGVIGASSSNALINAVMNDRTMNFEQLVSIFDNTTQAIQINQDTLFTSLESLAQGVSIVDKSLCLVAWNKAYADIFDYPEHMLKVGTPIEVLVRFNAERGECGTGEVNQLVLKRMMHLRKGNPHKFVRQRSDGRVIEMIGNPLPHGGFVTSFTDITEHIELQNALQETNIDLEKRISSRTDEVQAINSELRNEIKRRMETEKQLIEAREFAEQANASKTHFLALASHDILQPLNSAKLYLSAAQSMEKTDELASTLAKLNNSILAGETLISTLLEIARCDQGALSPQYKAVNLSALLNDLEAEFSKLAEQKQLSFTCRVADNLWVKTDPLYLQRIVRNLLVNAIKYTAHGGILLAVRQRQGAYLLQVWDTGEGITTTDYAKVFQDFYRAHQGKEQGVGLGLSVVSRFSRLLNLPVDLRSKKARGSCFSIHIPMAEPVPVMPEVQSIRELVSNITVLCLDDDEQNLDAMQTLLSKWHIRVLLAANVTSAQERMSQHDIDVIVADYQLGEKVNGLEFIQQTRHEHKRQIPAILITAIQEPYLIDMAQNMDVSYLSKPVKPAKLRALLSQFKH